MRREEQTLQRGSRKASEQKEPQGLEDRSVAELKTKVGEAE